MPAAISHSVQGSDSRRRLRFRPGSRYRIVVRGAQLPVAWVELLDVVGGLSRLAHHPVGVFPHDDLLDLRREVEREEYELRGIRAHGLVHGCRERDPEGAVRVRALTDELVRNLRSELVRDRVHALVHLPEEGFVLSQPMFPRVHVLLNGERASVGSGLAAGGGERRLHASHGRGPDGELTPPELEALGAAHGESAQETAGRLLKAMDTVKLQRRSVIAKLRARNMMHAVYLASSKV
jgi:DNA-binding NarL/FixJ family response regulator